MYCLILAQILIFTFWVVRSGWLMCISSGKSPVTTIATLN
ncbi:hypothetical protein FDUTEX481_02227 [Tolypothrix sp. PCC 7601]|nr:hypothetical protein FDUTEX481_02227 [Tolypothrix sp. PCC 7601]